ncbi:DUF4837 family protein [Psychroserpens ponticola]|uniref:DUF4837 family protein n=1 Tax=Psychroserpens ponticola TaxID=2932268 RepID=A0ABY7RWZ3_9FLAO|nr:DUF4837 family protein [Psychroserpens ponticola]WCO01661.1 DUF4837 family protein [Psychroserpens ponticola]
MKNILALLLLTITLFYGCNDKNAKRVVPKSSGGSLNDITVVVDNLLWENNVGEVVRDTLAASVEGLSIPEAQFRLRQMPPSVFTGFATKNRTVLKIEKGKPAETLILTDKFAKPQTVVVISGNTNVEIIDQINTNSVKIVDAFKKEELKEKQRRIKKALFNDKDIKERLGLSLRFPTAYRIAKNEDGFFWLRRDIETGTVDIMLYEAPLSSIRKGDSAVVDIVRLRDSVGKIHIEGPLDGSYMATENKYTPFISKTILDNKPAFETKGLWDVKNAFMSGPFINYAIEDKVNNRIVIVEGYVFAPSVAKRDYMFELEAIIKSITIK